MCSALPTTRRLRHQLSSRAIAEVTEHPGGLARGQAQAPGSAPCLPSAASRAGIACQTEHIIDAMLLAPPHQRLVGEAAVTGSRMMRTRGHVWRIWPMMRVISSTQAIAAGNIRTPLPGQQQMPAAEHVVERQVAVRAHNNHGRTGLPERRAAECVGIVEIEHDLARRTLMRLQEKLDQQRVNLWPVTIDPVILRGMAFGRVLETIERALASPVLPQSDRSTGCSLPVSTPNVGSLRSSSWSSLRSS